MGIFTRFRDIISSNMNSMLDKAEDPEKLIKLMIREMEDTLVEIKASCAGALASRKKVTRRLDDVKSKENYWGQRASLAVDKGRDDLAREALSEKRRFTQLADSLQRESTEHDDMVRRYQEDIHQLEDKLIKAREKQRTLVQRHIRARRKKRAQEEIRRMDSNQAMARFDALEDRVERMEAEADPGSSGGKSALEDEFDKLLDNDDIEKELKALKTARAGKEKIELKQ